MAVKAFELGVKGRAIRVLLADLQEHISAAKLADRLYSRSGHELTLADALIVRSPVDHPIPDTNTITQQMAPLFERVVKLPVYILGSNNFAHVLSHNIHSKVVDTFTEEERISLIPTLRQAELSDIAIKRTKAILQAGAATIFRTPSKSYCNRFLRTGNVQIDRGILDVFFFWLLPWLRDCHAILAETWTISSIVLNATRLLARYAPAQGRCKVEMIGEYYDGSAEAEAIAEPALERLLNDTTGAILVVFSACMTGDAALGLKGIVERHYHRELTGRFVSLYNLREEVPIGCLCELYKDLPGAFQHYADLPTAPHELQIIDIDKNTYFPLEIKQTEICVDRSAAKPASQFFQEYARADIFSVHRNSYLAGQKIRHHCIYPDVSRLLAQKSFQAKFAEKINTLDSRPALIITPPHDSGRELAEFASNVIRSTTGAQVPVWQHLDLKFSQDLSEQDAELRRTLAEMDEKSAILIVDDVSVTGDRLTRYAKGLRDLFQGQIHYVVGLARPERSDDWKRRVRDLIYRDGPLPRHTVGYVEFLLLPDWNEGSCPWCAEQTIYRNLTFKHLELPPDLARRNALLAKGEGLRSPFFAYPADKELRLGDNSIFAPAGSPPATVFAAVASAIQQLRTRTDPEHNLSVHFYPQVKCIPDTDYLGNTFRDPLLRVALLRAARRPELERVSGEDESKRLQAAKAIMMDPDVEEHCVTIELLLAMTTRKLPRVTLGEEERQIAHLIPLHTLIDALLG
jgi:hypothetical protein